MLYCCRYLHLQFLIHISSQPVSEEYHHKATRANHQHYQQEVKEPADDVGENCSLFSYHSARISVLQA